MIIIIMSHDIHNYFNTIIKIRKRTNNNSDKTKE